MKPKYIKTILVGASSVLIFVMVALLSTSPSSAASGSPFLGSWYGTDLDGSNIRLVIGGNPVGPFQITSTDSYISFCHGEAGILKGTASLNPENSLLLDANMEVICFTTGDTLEIVDSFVYDPATDTLSGLGVNWYRAGARSAGAGSPFLGSWYGTDLDGSDIRLVIGGNPDGPFQIISTDSYISFCHGEAGIIQGTGTLNAENSNVIEANVRVICFTTGNTLDFGTSFIYDPATDTLYGMSVTWY